MWALIATAAAGLEAGHGLAGILKHNALIETGVPEYTAGGLCVQRAAAAPVLLFSCQVQGLGDACSVPQAVNCLRHRLLHALRNRYRRQPGSILLRE
jgi:hypothetical protein